MPASSFFVAYHVIMDKFEDLPSNVKPMIKEKVSARLMLAMNVFEVLPLDKNVLRRAFASEFKDKEDALVSYSAIQAPQIKYLITRNGKDFKHSHLQVVTPGEMLALV